PVTASWEFFGFGPAARMGNPKGARSSCQACDSTNGASTLRHAQAGIVKWNKVVGERDRMPDLGTETPRLLAYSAPLPCPPAGAARQRRESRDDQGRAGVPLSPLAPSAPVAPAAPAAPATPAVPAWPVDPFWPAAPSKPDLPSAPDAPERPSLPAAPAVPEAPGAPSRPRTSQPTVISSNKAVVKMSSRFIKIVSPSCWIARLVPNAICPGLSSGQVTQEASTQLRSQQLA
ncbi:MAG: hypothetical protein JWN34_2979, partial [Bryobacterales bacterium]|nr:hypothetical protein [Bryobacterales bacterium]